jgi:hypothetical protein
MIMSLDDFQGSAQSKSVSDDGYHSPDSSKYKDEEWLQTQLQSRSISDIADEFGVAYNSVYYYIDKYGLNDDKNSSRDPVERYISQFIDTDGSIQVNPQARGESSNFTPEVSCANTFKVEAASLIDTEGSISVPIKKQSRNELGYKPTPSIDTSQSFHDQQLAALRRFYSMIEVFCDHIDINSRYSVSERESSVLVRWQVNKWDDVAKVLKTVKPHLVLKVEQANIFLNEIYPVYKDEKHNTKEGFMELAGKADEMAELRDGNGKRKYTQEYFENTEVEDW